METQNDPHSEHLTNPFFSLFGYLMIGLYVITFGSLGVITILAILFNH